MWQTLGKLEMKRNIWEALFFYFVYGASGIFLCGVIMSLITNIWGSSTDSEMNKFLFNLAPILGGLYTLVIAVALIMYKNISKDAIAILCALIGTFSSASLGMIFGFIPIAVLSGFAPSEKQ